MAQASSIEWTDATWNPVRGCSRVSPGCQNCYAERMAARFSGPGRPFHELAVMTKAGPRWTNNIRLIDELVDLPLRWRRPRMIFVNSMSDLFHESVPQSFIARVFETMHRAGHHRFQVLTKRSTRLRALGQEIDRPKNVWMGVSVEDRARASRIADLREVPAAVRFLSLEPLLGPLPDLVLDCIHWVIVGGESGPGARPMRPEWVGDIRDQCQRANMPFFFKQWGGTNKKKTGRLFEGRTWDAMPALDSATTEECS